MRKKYKNREDWLKARINGIGASETAIILGENPWQTNYELWELKTGKTQPTDLSGNRAVEIGTKAEEHLRGLFEVLHPQYKVEHYPYDMLYQEDMPFLFATLDGELTEKETNRKGILEIKTTSLQRRQIGQWSDQIPNHYFIQILSQMASTGYNFAVVYALLMYFDGTSEIKAYYFEREDYSEDIEYIKKEVGNFWKENVKKNIAPSLLLPTLGDLI